MERLLKGVKEFADRHHKDHEDLFRDLAHEQNPHTLFIGCSDARLVSNLITSTLPGDLFIMRNIANIVPPYEVADQHLSASSIIEYAVGVLEVENIVICGHSNCGGCGALDKDKKELDEIPHTFEWLNLARPAFQQIIENKSMKDDDFREAVEKANIVLQRKHLLSYPIIRKAYDQGKLTIFGWYYNIGHSIVENYNAEKDVFEDIE